jgi:XTP/dITP diphosphohydrolase
MRKIVFATNNRHKTEEVQSILKGKYEALTLQDIGFDGDIPETAPTLEGNALQKARFVYEQYHVACFADDTGLEVDALGGAPGVHSARYAGDDKNSENNIDKLLNELGDSDNRRARFRCVIAYIDETGGEHLFEGIVAGDILTERQGDGGFGYDSVFRPDGFDCSFAQMSLTDKNRISHRGLAVQKFTETLLGN